MEANVQRYLSLKRKPASLYPPVEAEVSCRKNDEKATLVSPPYGGEWIEMYVQAKGYSSRSVSPRTG